LYGTVFMAKMMVHHMNNIKKYLNNHPLLASMIVFLCIVLIFTLVTVKSNGDPLRGDHYFHFKYAYLLRTEGLDAIKNFDWIYLGGVGRYNGSLFQVSLIPFTYLNNWLMALSMVDAFYASITISIIYYILKKTRVRFPLFFALTLFTSTYFIARIFWGRAFVLVIALTFMEMRFAIEKKYKALFFTILFHILWHQNTYFMPLIVIGIVETSRYLVYQKMYIKNVISTLIAIVVGMTFFPGFPNSLIGWMRNIFVIQSDKSLNQNVQSIGGLELAAKDFVSTFVNEKMLLALLIFCIFVVVFLYIKQKNKSKSFYEKIDKTYFIWTYSLFIFVILTLFGSITISGRLFDFLIPSIFVLCAFIVTILIKSQKVCVDRLLLKYFAVGVIMYVAVLSLNTLTDAYLYANKFDYNPTGQVAKWIEEKSDGRDKVFLLNWSDFTTIFFSNHNNVYATGIEPMTLKTYDEALYWKYYNIFNYHHYCEKQGDCTDEIEMIREYINNNNDKRGIIEKKNSANMINSIKNDFDAKFIVSSSPSFTRAIELHPELISDSFHIKSDKYTGKSMEFTVFKLK